MALSRTDQFKVWVKRNPFKASWIGWIGITLAGFGVLSLVRSEMDSKRRIAYKAQIEAEMLARAKQEEEEVGTPVV
ncbi:hypothetical protein HDU79_005506 [Rhizoclosmatium sp. JEL0117]|nr:hypothetical protein HDU79_005506 [Rhizoclosmatium sp. JEL0117]